MSVHGAQKPLLVATVNRWLSRANSRRTVLLLRGTVLPFSSGIPGKARVPELGDDLSIEYGQRIFPQVQDENFCFLVFPCLCGCPLGGGDFTQVALQWASTVIRSADARWMYTPRTISSSVLRAQSSASRLVRKVFGRSGPASLAD